MILPRERDASSKKVEEIASTETGLLWCKKSFLAFQIVWAMIPTRAPRIKENFLRLFSDNKSQMEFELKERGETLARA